MAIVNDSGDENIANNKFKDFEISENDLFFFEDDQEVTDPAAHLKKLLKIFRKLPYDNPHDISNIKDFTDFSDDNNKGAAAMQVASESDSEVEINPYWSKIKVNELQGLGNPIEDPGSDMDSMPDLETISELDDSSIIFILNPPNSPCSEFADKASSEGQLDSFNDEEMVELAMDEGEDGCTAFTAAMLVNVEGSIEGVQTKLYNSRASQHMSPYREQFKNYVSIVPKSITAADKCYFQAIGKGDLCIKLPNGSVTTTILLKDVLHCPNMGLTLVSISKITAAGYKVVFQGPTCKIFNLRDKVVGLINIKSGLNCVDHEVMVNVGMAGEACKILTVKELHRQIGHIAPEAAKKMVSSGAVRGIELNPSTTIQSCDSCEYAKATCKPIRKTHEEPRTSKFGNEIHSDVWGPSPVQTPGQKEYYVSSTDDHT